MISKKNELAAWALIKKHCQDGISAYPTTVEEDEKVLEDSNLSFNHRNCVLFTHGEKEILHFLSDLADTVT